MRRTAPGRRSARRSGVAALGAAILCGSLLVGCAAGGAGSRAGDGSGSGSSDASDNSGAEVIAEGLEAPWSIAFRGETALVSERDSGRILELVPGAEDAPHETREVGTVPGVAAGGEGGLLGILVHDDHLYAYSTAEDGNRIQRFPLTGEPGELALGEADTLLDGIPAAGNHNGGRIAIGPDGMLYATTGDAGDAADAQDRDSLAGKILRLDPTGGIPDDNPFPGSPVWSLGHRNPQGIAWAEDGRMLASEFGQNTWDELNIIEPGENYGWPEVEGIAGDPRYLDPVQQWEPGAASPSGIAVLGETVYLANLRGSLLREVPLGALDRAEERFAGELGRLRDAVAAPDGSLWILTNNTDGRGTPGPADDRVLRLAPDALDPAPR